MSLSNVEKVSSPNSDFDPTQAAAAIWAAAQHALAEGVPEQFSNQAVQQLMTAAVKLFTARVEKDDQFFSPLLGQGDLVTATEVVVTVSELMRAASLNPFDLAMWFNRRSS
jgi:hypothetical protein